jgi:hypothetical protein
MFFLPVIPFLLNCIIPKDTNFSAMTDDKKNNFKRYNTTISKLFRIILSLNSEQQEILLKYAKFLRQKEKRSNDRKICHIKIIFATSELISQSYIEDISSTGLFIKAGEPILVGEKLLMLFNLEGVDKIVKIRGEIVHTTDDGIGVKFRNYISPATKELNSIIAQMQ